MLHPKLQQATEAQNLSTIPMVILNPLIMQWAKTSIIMALQFCLLMVVKSEGQRSSIFCSSANHSLSTQ